MSTVGKGPSSENSQPPLVQGIPGGQGLTRTLVVTSLQYGGVIGHPARGGTAIDSVTVSVVGDSETVFMKNVLSAWTGRGTMRARSAAPRVARARRVREPCTEGPPSAGRKAEAEQYRNCINDTVREQGAPRGARLRWPPSPPALDIDAADQPHAGYMWSIGSGTYQGFISYDHSDIGGNIFLPRNPCCSLAMDAQNQPHLLVCPNEPDSMVLWEHESNDWTQEPLPPGSWGALAIDGTGVFHLAYYDPIDHDLVYGSRSSGVWTFEPVDQTGDVGQYPSLDIDAAGGVHVTYYDVSNANLVYARRAPAGPWYYFTPVDEYGDVGEYSSLRFRDGVAHVSYYDRTNGDLKYATAEVPTPARSATLGGVKALYRDRR